MIGVVIVSHSAMLAEGVAELAKQVAQDKVRLAAAGGTANPASPIGTDALRVLEAIESVYSADGVLVLMDLGSAVLSAETALEFLDEPRRSPVRLCPAPLVEGAIAAVSLAAAGGTLDEVIREAERALSGKIAQLPGSAAIPPPAGAAAAFEERVVTLRNRLGLHARPAARFIRLARGFDAHVTVGNVTARTGLLDASSLNGVLTLAARQGHQLLIRAEGREASGALTELAAFVESGCGDTDEARPSTPPATSTAAGRIPGIAAAAGVAVAPLLKYRPAPDAIPPRVAGEPNDEWRLVQSAITGAQDETRTLCEWTRRNAGDNEAGIFDAQSLFLEDPELIEQTRRLVFDEHRDAASAWQAAAGEFTRRLGAIDDPYLSARAADLSDVAGRVLRRIAGAAGAPSGSMNHPSWPPTT